MTYLRGSSLDEILSRSASPSVYYYEDIRGSIRGITDSNSKLIQSYEYTAFGERTTDIKQKNFLFFGSKINQPYGFTGRPIDKVTGLYDYRFRNYNPEIGRFIQPDPLGQIPGPNIYAYCNNNPINWVDPWGMDVYYLRDKGGAGGAGHTALLVGNPSTGYRYLSYSGVEAGIAWSALGVDLSKGTLETREFNTFEEAQTYLSDSGSGGVNRYEDVMRFNSTAEQDSIITREFMVQSLQDYNMGSHNCDQVTVTSMLEGGILMNPDWVSPNGTWETIKNQMLYDEIGYNWGKKDE